MMLLANVREAALLATTRTKVADPSSRRAWLLIQNLGSLNAGDIYVYLGDSGNTSARLAKYGSITFNTDNPWYGEIYLYASDTTSYCITEASYAL